MKTLELSSLSTEYIRCAVSAKEAGVAVDPTTDTVHFAFKTTGEPEAGDWVAGSWETAGSTYYARVLVGPNGETLADGGYDVWLRITDSPEVPVRRVGRLHIS